MSSPAQIEANRKNAQKSTGPRTKAGKDVSRANAIVHGLSGRGVVILEEFKEEVANLAACYVGMLGGPHNASPHDIELAEQVALDSVRSKQCLDMEEGLFLEDSVNAEFGWDHAQTTAALDLAESLPRKPALISHKLEEFTHGCAYKIERWTWLIGHLDDTPDTPWDADCRAIAFDLLGIPREFRKVCKKIETLAQQRALALHEIERLRKKQTDWLDRLSAFRRDQTIDGMIFPSKAVWRLRRYGMAASRRYFSGMSRIMKRQEVLSQVPNAPSTDCEVVAAAALERERTRQQTSREVRESEAYFKAMLDLPAPVKPHTLSSAATVPAPKPLPSPATKPEPIRNDASDERKQRRADKKRQRQARKRRS